MNEEVKTKFKLPNKKVKVVPIRRKGAWLPPNHEAAHVFGSASKKYSAPLAGKGRVANPLTREEQDFLEGLLDKDLNPYKNFKENFYIKHFVRLTNEMKILDLSLPEDYLDYKVLLLQKDEIAQSGKDKFSKGTYKYFIDDLDYEDKTRYKSTTAKKEAYKWIGKLEDKGKTAMIDFLNVFYRTKPGKRADDTMSIEALTNLLDAALEDNIDEFLHLAGDPEYDTKVFIHKALQVRALSKEGNVYSLPDGTPIAKSEDEVILWLKDGVNDEYRLQIQARIEQ